MLQEIDIRAQFGAQWRKVHVGNPFQGIGHYHLMIDNYYQGQINYIGGEWVFHLHESCILETADLQILTELIEENNYLVKR